MFGEFGLFAFACCAVALGALALCPGALPGHPIPKHGPVSWNQAHPDRQRVDAHRTSTMLNFLLIFHPLRKLYDG